MKGHVSRRGKTWAYWFDIDPDPLTGKRRQQTKSGFKSEKEAWKQCRAALADYEKGGVVSSSRRKVGDALEEWLSRIEHSIKPSMVQNWRNYAAYYVIPYIGQRDVQEIDGGVCDALYAKLLAEGPHQGEAEDGICEASDSCPPAQQWRQGSAVPPLSV